MADKAFKKCPGELHSKQSIDRLFQPADAAEVPACYKDGAIVTIRIEPRWVMVSLRMQRMHLVTPVAFVQLFCDHETKV